MSDSTETKHPSEPFFPIDDNDVQLETFVTYRISVLSDMLKRQSERFLKRNFDLSSPEWRVMVTIGSSGLDAVSVRDLASRSKMDKALISRTASKLTKRGLISSKPDITDGRLVALSLTKAGKALYQKILPLSKQRQERLYQCLDSDIQEAFDKALNQLLAATYHQEQNQTDHLDTW